MRKTCFLTKSKRKKESLVIISMLIDHLAISGYVKIRQKKIGIDSARQQRIVLDSKGWQEIA